MAGTVDVGTLLVRYNADTGELIAGNLKAKSSIESTGAAASGMGSMVAMGAVVAGAAVVGMGVKAVSMAANFQSSMTQLVTGAGESARNLKMVSDGILAMATQTGTSTKDLAAGMYNIESAGYHGGAGLDVLRASAEGAKVGNASLADVANGVTTAMTDYSKSGLTAAQATNTLIATVAAGKTHMSDLANAMSTILPTSAAVGVGFTDVSAAMATMTGEGTDAASAATYLRQLLMAMESPGKQAVTTFQEIGLSAQQVSDGMKKSLPDTLQMITDALKKKFPEGSAAYVSALKDIAGGSKQMQGILELTGNHMKTFQGNVDGISGAVKKGGDSIVGWASVTQDFNFKMDKAKEVVETLGIKIGTALLPVVGRIADFFSGSVVPALTAFINNGNLLIPVLSGIGAIIAAVLIPAVGTLAVEVAVATWPFLLIGAAVAGLVAIFMHFYQTNAPFKAFIDNLVKGFQQLWAILVANVVPAFQAIGNFIATVVFPILQRIGAYLVSTFKPVWDQLVTTFKSQLVPAWNDLVKAIQPLLPTLQMAAEGLGMILGAALVIAIGIVGGLIHAFASFLSGVIMIFGGVVEVISGAIKVVAGIIAFFTDLLTFRFDKLGGDLGTIMNGIGTMFHGVWEIIKGIFQAAIGAVVGFVAGFGQTIVGIVQALSDTLVGHSIIPDMINSIVSWFQQLPGRAGAAIQSMANMVMSGLNNLAASAWQAGSNIVSGIANGITAGIGAVGTAIGNVTSFIAAHLPHSPAKIGPLRDLQQSGANIVQQLNAGMLSAQPNLQATMTHVVAYPIRPNAIGVAASSAQSVAAIGGSGDHTTIVEIDGYQLATLVQKKTDRLVRLKLGAKGRSI